MDVILFNFLFVYIEVNVICIILSAIIFAMVSPDMANNREVFAFKCLTVVYIIMLTADCFTQLTYRKVVEVPAIPLATIYALYTIGFGTMAFYWFRFLEFRIDPGVKYSKKFWGLISMPLIILVFFSLGSIWKGWIFTINDEGIFQRGPFFALQTLVGFFYFIASAAHAIRRALVEISPLRKRQLVTVASYIIVPSIGAAMQLIFSTGLPIIGPSIVICVVFMYISIQKGQTNRDALTGVENRRSLDHELEERISRTADKNTFYLFMIDADNFKQINDEYGHFEGDRALKLIAEALQSPTLDYERFTARYGGDEFVVLVEDKQGDAFKPDKFVDDVNNLLEHMRKRDDVGFTISISAGYSRCTSNLISSKKLIQDADKMLYERKENARMQRSD